MLVLPPPTNDRRLFRGGHAIACLILVPIRSTGVESYPRRDQYGGEAYARAKTHEGHEGRDGFRSKAGHLRLLFR